MSYKNKLVDIYIFIKNNYDIEKIIWEENLIMIHIEHMKYISIKIPNDDSTDIYCFLADHDDKKIPDSDKYKKVNDYKELLTSLIEIENKMGIIQCPNCKSKIIK